MDNIDITLKKEIIEVENSKIKFFFIGAIIGVIPYLLLLAVINDNLNNRLIFRNTLIVFALLSLFVNGIIISKTIYKRYKVFMEFKYDIKYEELKKRCI